MNSINRKILSATLFPLALLLLVSGCSDSSDRKSTGSITVTSYNMGLALNYVPYTNERLVANEALLADYDSDVICFQEVWLEEHVEAVEEAVAADYPHTYTVEPEQVFSETAACTNEEVSGFADCAIASCPDLSGADLVACAPVQCGAFLLELSPDCFDGVVGAAGIPEITIDDLVETVTQPAGKFAYDGSLGLMLASKYELRNREFQDFIDDSSVNHRGALYAEILLNQRTHVVACAHPTADLSSSIDYPSSGKHGSWEGENRFMQEQMIGYANDKAGTNPVYFSGDFNCGFANPGNNVDAEFSDNCQLWLDDGFTSPAAEQLPCTFCYEDNLILQESGRSGGSLIDHVFVKNVQSGGPIIAERVFDDPVSIEALIPPSELKPEDSPKMTHPSDHFGVELEIRLK